jgi:hypothetical protein
VLSPWYQNYRVRAEDSHSVHGLTHYCKATGGHTRVAVLGTSVLLLPLNLTAEGSEGQRTCIIIDAPPQSREKLWLQQSVVGHQPAWFVSQSFSKAWPGQPHPEFSPHPAVLTTQKCSPHPACSRKVNRPPKKGGIVVPALLALVLEAAVQAI